MRDIGGWLSPTHVYAHAYTHVDALVYVHAYAYVHAETLVIDPHTKGSVDLVCVDAPRAIELSPAHRHVVCICARSRVQACS